MDADQAACDYARLQVEYCTIRSPLDARAGGVLVKAGNLIKANDATMVALNQIAPTFVTFSVPEGELPAIREQMAANELKVKALIPGDTGAPEQGTLTFMDNAVDTTTGTILLKATFPNEGRRLWPGQFVNIVLVLATQPDAVVVTKTCQSRHKPDFIRAACNHLSAAMRLFEDLPRPK